jgi:HTH-type transcriptional regulator, sugar sensing transcriptional regulator
MEFPQILRQLGFSEREIKTYLVLLAAGPGPVRRIAKDAELARSATQDALVGLEKRHLVRSYRKHKKEFFSAEDPETLMAVAERQEQSISTLKRGLTEALPELRSLYAHGGSRPTVKYFEGAKGVALILEDVLRVMGGQENKMYRVCSSLALRDQLYKEFPHFTKERIERHVSVRVIAAGSGGEEQPFSERRWLPKGVVSPTYKLIFGPKTAFISLGADGAPLGVLIEDESVAETERIIFDRLWDTLAE